VVLIENEVTIYDNYPCNKKLSEKQIQDILVKIIQKIVLFSTLNDAPFFTLNGAVSA
jgi:hypothetical protein